MNSKRKYFQKLLEYSPVKAMNKIVKTDKFIFKKENRTKLNLSKNHLKLKY